MAGRSAITFRRLTLADIGEASKRVYLPAFLSNAAYNMCFLGVPDEDIPRALEWLFSKRLRLLLEAGAIGMGAFDASGRVQACVCGVPPGCRPSLWAQVRAGLLSWPCRWGWASFKAVMDADNRTGAAPPESYEVSMMAVEPALQGRGVGSALLRLLMDELKSHARAAAAAAAAVPAGGRKDAVVHLNTQKAINVAFYQRAGFRLTGIRRIHPLTGRFEVLPLSDAAATTAGATRSAAVRPLEPGGAAGAAETGLRARKPAAVEAAGIPSEPSIDRSAPFLSWTLCASI